MAKAAKDKRPTRGGWRAGAGRPPSSPEYKARALALAEELGSPEAAAEQLRAEGAKVASGAQIRQWQKDAQRGAVVAPVAVEVAQVEPPRAALELPRDVSASVFHVPDPGQVAAIRALVVSGGVERPREGGKPDEVERVPIPLGPDFVERVRAGTDLTARDVRALLLEAAVEERLDALPPELARARSIATAERALVMAEEAHDQRSILDAQRHIDRLRLERPAPDPEGLTRAEVVILLRRIAGELQGVVGGGEALQRALSEA